MEVEADPVLCLLDHLLTMAFHDDVFEKPINLTKVGIFRNFVRLTMKQDVLDMPIFRKPKRDEFEDRISRTYSLKATTWLRYLQRLGRNFGLEQSFTQYCARRGSINVVNSTSLPSLL